jgi:hypothetical protein
LWLLEAAVVLEDLQEMDLLEEGAQVDCFLEVVCLLLKEHPIQQL